MRSWEIGVSPSLREASALPPVHAAQPRCSLTESPTMRFVFLAYGACPRSAVRTRVGTRARLGMRNDSFIGDYSDRQAPSIWVALGFVWILVPGRLVRWLVKLVLSDFTAKFQAQLALCLSLSRSFSLSPGSVPRVLTRAFVVNLHPNYCLPRYYFVDKSSPSLRGGDKPSSMICLA